MSLVSNLELKEFDSASLTGAYQNFGSALSNPCYYAYLINDSDVDVYISKDGSTNHIRLPSGVQIPLTYYSRHNSLIQGSYLFSSGTQLSIKQVTASGTGFITINLLTTS
jgi:hypothetical protein